MYAPASGTSSIGYAARKAHADLVTVLLEAKASVDAHAMIGAHALSADVGVSKPVMQLLIKHKGNLDCRNQDGSGALHVAVCHKSKKRELTAEALEWFTKQGTLHLQQEVDKPNRNTNPNYEPDQCALRITRWSYTIYSYIC